MAAAKLVLVTVVVVFFVLILIGCCFHCAYVRMNTTTSRPQVDPSELAPPPYAFAAQAQQQPQSDKLASAPIMDCV